MRILWIEDLGHDDCPEHNLDQSYEWKRVSTYFIAKSEIENNINQYDIVLLDINLTGNSDTSSSISKECLKGVLKKDDSPFELDPETFLKEAGFHLYIQLLEQGFPISHVAFLSANIGGGQQTYNAFKEKFNEARIKSPRAFEKNATNTQSKAIENPFELNHERKSKLAQWLNNCETPYIKLRRGITDVCDELEKKLDEDEKYESSSSQGKRLNSLSGLKKAMANSLEIQDFNDRLYELKNILPLRVPKDKKNLLKRLARSVVHQWDNPVQSKEYGAILKTARNWLSHGDMEISEIDVAFLFVLHARSISSTVSKGNVLDELIEKSLLSLFGLSELDECLDETIISSYYTMRREYKETKNCTEKLCKELLGDGKKSRYIDFIRSYQAHCEHKNKTTPDMKYLYRSFFHQFLGRKSQEKSKEVFRDGVMKAYAQAWIKLAHFDKASR